MIQALWTKFPGLKPKQIERLLADFGHSVDANLIGQARLRGRKAKRDEQVLLRLLGKVFERRPDLWPVVQSSPDEVAAELVQIATARPGLSDDEVVEQLATRLSERASQGAGRVSHIFLRVLDEHPQYRRSYELGMGAEPGGTQSVIFYAKGLDDLPDDEVEKFVLAWLEENYPPGPTAEAVARAYLARQRQKAAEAKEEDAIPQPDDDEAEWDDPDQDQLRVDAALAMLLSEPGARASVGLDQLREYVEQIAAEHPDWTDGRIADHVLELRNLRNDQEAAPADNQKDRFFLTNKDLEAKEGLRKPRWL